MSSTQKGLSGAGVIAQRGRRLPCRFNPWHPIGSPEPTRSDSRVRSNPHSKCGPKTKRKKTSKRPSFQLAHPGLSCSCQSPRYPSSSGGGYRMGSTQKGPPASPPCPVREEGTMPDPQGSLYPHTHRLQHSLGGMPTLWDAETRRFCQSHTRSRDIFGGTGLPLSHLHMPSMAAATWGSPL